VTGGRSITALSEASTTSVTSIHEADTTKPGNVAAKAPGWRLVATLGEAHGVPVTGSIAATSGTTAWSVWTGSGFAEVARWTGKTWVKMPLPAKYAAYAHAAITFAGASADDFWLFSSAHRTQALHWNGKSWQLIALPSWVLVARAAGASAVAFGPGNVWIFSLGAGAVAAHYNGQVWAKVKLPDAPVAVAGLAAGDIFVLAKNSVLRWTGSKWHTIGDIPPVPIPIGGSFTADGFTASGPGNAWLAASAYDKPGNLLGRFLFHWNGKSWTTVPRPANVDFGSLVSDGTGGLWASGVVTDNPGGFWNFYHLSGGHWTEVAPPTPVFNHEQEHLTWIPGTRSVWGVGTIYNTKGDLDTGILKYGA